MSKEVEVAIHPTPEEVWNTLSPIDVSAHTEERMGLTYLSWVFAVRVMKENFPEYTVEWHGGSPEMPDVFYYKDGSAMVACTVHIGPLVSEYMWLPVMNPGKGPRGAKYESRELPTSRDISDTKQRCLVKCFAMLGLGLYIYAGEDLPPKSSVINPQEMEVNALITQIKTEVKDLKDSGWEWSDEDKDSIRSAIRDRDKLALEGITSLMLEVRDKLVFNQQHPPEEEAE